MIYLIMIWYPKNKFSLFILAFNYIYLLINFFFYLVISVVSAYTLIFIFSMQDSKYSYNDNIIKNINYFGTLSETEYLSFDFGL